MNAFSLWMISTFITTIMIQGENSKVSESYLGTTWEQCANEILVSLKAIGSV